LAWVRQIRIRDLRNIQDETVDLHPGLNVFFGRNAQGKTSLLEAVGLVARGRSFRTDDAPSMIRRGAEGLAARAEAGEEADTAALEVEISPGRRAFRVDGRDVLPREYHGRLEVVVYSTDRLRVVKGSMRDRRQFLDRSAAALWPSYRGAVREFERVLVQRNAALEARRRDEEAWTERFVLCGARLRHRRAAYAARLTAALASGFRPGGESYEVVVPGLGGSEQEERSALAEEVATTLTRERAAGRSLAGPHRDVVTLHLDGPGPQPPAGPGPREPAGLPRGDGPCGGGASRRPRLRARRGAGGRPLRGGRAPGAGPGHERPFGLGGEPEAVGPDLPRLGGPGALCLTPSERTET
jgi:DNA replication and repair protein RecF